jgi:TatD DNase family protein
MTPDGTRHGVRTGLVDTHCHLFLMKRGPAEVVEEAVRDGVSRMVCAGIDPETTRRSIEIAEAHREVFATSGMHPHTASALDDDARSAIEELLAHPRVVGVGETGLDYYRMHSPREDQVASFRWHVRLSNEAARPVVVHVREAWDDVLAVLGEERAERVVIHCFSGDADQARECSARGYTLSFAANVTYPRNAHLREAAAAVDRSRLVVETDSPFLPPHDLRGRENVPGNARAAVQVLARERGEDPDDLAGALADNARRAFGLPRGPASPGG